MKGNLNSGLFSLVCVPAAVLIFAFLAGCGQGLPKNVKESAKQLLNDIQSTRSIVEQDREKYQAFTKSPDFKTLERFAKAENWPGSFDSAKQNIDRSADLYDKELKPLLKRNRPDSVAKVQQQVHRIKKILSEVREQSRFPLSRSAAIQNTIANAAQIRSTAAGNADRIQSIAEQFKNGPVQKALSDFPDAAAQINAKIAPFTNIEQEAKQDLSALTTAYDAHLKDGKADYALITDKADSLSQNLEKLTLLEEKTASQIKNLYKSYTKILKDMKVNYQVTIRRESWDESSDFYNPGVATFTRQVTEDVYEKITADSIDSIAAILPGYGGPRFSSKIGDAWNALSINPTEQWPSRYHNAAEFWIEDSSEAYYHKYLLEQDGETSETGWQKVSESMYEANLEYLGMAILAKPYGVFEQDTLKQAAPPGMAYVGNPEYGEWKKDNNGDRFWSWYGRYAFFSSLFFFPPYYYPYHSWYGWHNNYRYKKPYFGKTQKGFQQFGTHGSFVRQSPNFQNTSFAKSGGLKSQTASVRGAGAGLRGGGPKNKGK